MVHYWWINILNFEKLTWKYLTIMARIINDAGHQKNKLLKAVPYSLIQLSPCNASLQWHLGDPIRRMSILFGIPHLVCFSRSRPFHRYYNLPLDSFWCALVTAVLSILMDIQNNIAKTEQIGTLLNYVFFVLNKASNFLFTATYFKSVLNTKRDSVLAFSNIQ